MRTLSLLILAVSLLLASCATTGGSLFTSVVSPSGSTSASNETAPSTNEPSGSGAPGTSVARGQPSAPATSVARGQSNAPATSVPRGPSTVVASEPGGSTGTVTVSVQTVAAAQQPAPGLRVTSIPSGASVYLNGRFIGDTPLFFSGFDSGTLKLSVVQDGYYPAERWVTLDNTLYSQIDVQLAPITGYLSLTVLPADAQPEVWIDGRSVAPGVTELPIGFHTLLVRAFGYDDLSTSFQIAESATTPVTIQLAKAAFRIADFSLSRPVLNPSNPGPLGRVVASFKVSTEGSATARITGPDKSVVWSEALPPFHARSQSFSWDGRSQTGAPLPDGSYTIEVSGRGVDGVDSSAHASVELSSAALVSYRSLYSGVSGLLYAPSAELLPLGSFQVGGLVLGHIESAGVLFPSQIALRFVPSDGVEIDAQGSVLAGSFASVPFSAGLSGKIRLLAPHGPDGLSAALTLKGTYLSGTTSDISTNFTGASLGVPIELRAGALGIVVDPEVIVSPYQVSYGSSTSPGSFVVTANGSTVVSLSSWGYARAGLFLDLGSLVTGLSAAVRSAPFSNGLALDPVPLAAGWELHWLLPNSNFVVSAAVAGEYSPTLGYYVTAGGGIGLLY